MNLREIKLFYAEPNSHSNSEAPFALDFCEIQNMKFKITFFLTHSVIFDYGSKRKKTECFSKVSQPWPPFSFIFVFLNRKF